MCADSGRVYAWPRRTTLEPRASLRLVDRHRLAASTYVSTVAQPRANTVLALVSRAACILLTHNIREAGMKEYGQVNRGTIQMWENEFRMGMPIKTGQPAFHRGCDFSAIKARLKKRQSLLHHMCPLPMRDEYEFGNWMHQRLRVWLSSPILPLCCVF